MAKTSSTTHTQFSPVAIEERQKLDIRPGDTVRVWQRVREGGKTRLQPFEGLVLARRHGTEPGATFTVRRVVAKVGVERIFPLYSPLIEKIELVRRSKVRRAKLYYIRKKAARQVRRKMKRMRVIGETLMDTEEQKASGDAEEQKQDEANKTENNEQQSDSETSGQTEQKEQNAAEEQSDTASQQVDTQQDSTKENEEAKENS